MIPYIALLMLALPVSAQGTALVGTWGAVILEEEIEDFYIDLSLTFRNDATFDLRYEFPTELLLSEDAFVVEDILGEIDDPPEILVEDLELLERLFNLRQITASGTYETKNDSLLVYPETVEYTLSDGDLLVASDYWNPIVTFITLVWVITLAGVFDPDLSSEEVDDEVFLEAYIEARTDPEIEESIAAAVDEGLQDNPFWPMLNLTGTYSIDGGALFITSELNDEPLDMEFNRVGDATTAVTQITWGRVKNHLR